MKSINCMLVGIAALGIASVPVQADTKVGFVNTVQLMEEAPQAKDAQSKIETEFAPREKELVELQKTIRKLEDQLSRDGAKLITGCQDGTAWIWAVNEDPPRRPVALEQPVVALAIDRIVTELDVEIGEP